MKRYAVLTLFLCLALFAGCGQEPLPAPTPEPTPAAVEPQTPATPPEELIEPLYSRLSEERIEALAPRDDYGALHPFAGELSYGANGAMEYKYGLFDSDGRIVCDPVYRSVGRLAAKSGFFKADYIPMLGLWRETSSNPLCTLASLDGSFVSPEYSYVIPLSFGVVCADNSQSEDFTVYGFDGSILFTEESRFEERFRIARANCFVSSVGSNFLAWLMDEESGQERVWLLTDAGEILAGGWVGAEFAGGYGDAVKFRTSEDGLWGLLSIYAEVVPTEEFTDDIDYYWTAKPLLEPEWVDIRPCMNGWYAQNEEGAYIYDGVGELICTLPEGGEYARWGYVHEGIYYLKNGSYDVSLGYYTPVNASENCPIIVAVEEEGCRIINIATGAERFVEDKDPGWSKVFGLLVDGIGPESSLPCLWYFAESPIGFWEVPVVTDWGLEKEYDFPHLGNAGAYAVKDGFTGEEFICVTTVSGVGELYRPDGSHFAAGGTWDSIWNGLLVISNEEWCFYAEPWGEAVFRYPVEITEDLRGTGFDPASDTDI